MNASLLRCMGRLLAQLGPLGHVCYMVAMRESGHLSRQRAIPDLLEYTA
jgi:hypothetical protein